jgi:hypothetical protein
MASAGTSDNALLAYIQNSQSAFGLSADGVIYLKDVGLSSQVITAMMNRDNALQGRPPVLASAPAPAPVAAPAPPPPAPPAPAPTYVSAPPADVAYFYSGLAPYGAWVQLPGYGWCWQPSVVAMNHSWRPYCDAGHWVYTDAGWCWVSDYSWGWAPFHYGRWYLHDRCGWVWVPDRVWGPAWVVWRNGGDFCGWAPLPPHAEFVVGLGWRFNGVSVGLNFDFGLRADCFAFIGLGDFCSHDLGRRCLPQAQVTKIYNRTTIINSYTVNNKVLVNRGIEVNRVAAATHMQIQKAAIRDLPAGGAHPRGGGAVVYRPQLKAPTIRPANMVAQKVDERHPVIQHPVAASGGSEPRSTPRANLPSSPQAPHRTPSEAQTSPARPPSGGTSVRPQESSSRAYQPGVSATATPQRSVQEHPAETKPVSASAATPSTSPKAREPQYYPKTYHQAAETHSLQPASSHSSAPGESEKKSESEPKKGSH